MIRRDDFFFFRLAPPARALPGLALPVFVALVALVLAAGCGKKVSPVAPEQNHPPAVVSLFPVPRSSGVPYDTQIYAQFDRELDPRTVDTSTVYLKIDARRTPITVEYLRIVNRIQVTPRYPLDLSRTYTVEIAARVKTAGGDSLGSKVFWQFSTNSLRRVTYAWPAQGALEGPHTLLSWGGNGGPTNNILYEVYASSDSMAVVNRTAPMLQRAVYVNYLPRISWTAGAPTYWAVTEVNSVTGERLEAPVASFRVYPADAPVDTLAIPLFDFGGAGSNARVQFCQQTTVNSGLAYNSGIRWNLSGDRPAIRVADATVTLMANSTSAGVVAGAGTQLWYAQNPWTNCNFTLGGAPFTETNGYLVTGVATGLQVDFNSPALSAFVEAGARYGGWNGLLMRGTATAVTWDMITPGVPSPVMKVLYYRPGTAPARAR